MRTKSPSPPLTKISERLYLGSSHDAESLAAANPHHIKTVLTLNESPVRHRAPAVRYLHFPVRDAQPIPLAWLNGIVTAIEEHFHRGAILVHGASGLSRSPIVVAAFLDRVGFMDFFSALGFIAEIRPAIAPSSVLVASVAAELSND